MPPVDGEIVTLDEAKQWLRIDHDEEDSLIAMLIAGAEQYLAAATGRKWPAENVIAKHVVLAHVADNYMNRETTVASRGAARDLRPAIQSMVAQLQYTPHEDEDGDS